jgi:hypothetical protein
MRSCPSSSKTVKPAIPVDLIKRLGAALAYARDHVVSDMDGESPTAENNWLVDLIEAAEAVLTIHKQTTATVWAVHYWDVSDGAHTYSVHRTRAGAEAAAWALVRSAWPDGVPIPDDLEQALREWDDHDVGIRELP